ncbi:MAG: fused MFS/spermidine synthase [Chloroflexi bacterium]|nr:fused MFS/spermidine synthase [Chloroflexota bacterium]
MTVLKQRAGAWPIFLYVVFLLSGFSGLAYQVVWIRRFGLIFGVTAFATSAVLSAYFAGLALGSWLAGRRLSRWRVHPLKLYAFLEVGVGAYALAIPFLLDSLNIVYAAVFPLLENSFYLLSLLRLFFSALVLIIPTTLMGATLPLLTEALAERVKNVTVNVSGLYAVNTLGALLGASFSGFYAIREFGMFETTLLAVAGNWLAALGAVIIARRLGAVAPQPSKPQPETRREFSPRYKALLLGLFLSGFAALGYEVVWTRVLSLFMGRTVFAYTTILCSALLGIAVGSWLLRYASPWIRRPVRVLALLELAVAALSLLSIGVISQAVPNQTDWGLPVSLGVILVIPNALLGATLPLAIRVYQAEFKHIAQSVGDLYSANVLGGVLGSFATGFVLLTLLGSQYTVVFLAVLNGFVALLFYRYAESGSRTWAWVGVGASALAVVFFLLQPQFLFDGIRRGIFGEEEILFHQEDVEGIVTVTQQGIHRTIYLNGSQESNDRPGLLDVHRGLAHLPLLLHPNPERILVVGLGSGTTAGAATQQPVKEIRVVELVPGMYQGAAYFAESNYDILNDPRVNLRVDDGRNHLLLTRDKFDVIEADLILPWHVGANNLYAAEYYRLVAARLKPNGIVAQWLDTGLPAEEYKLLLRTFISVFPNTTLWRSGNYAVAMPSGIRIDQDLLRARFADRKLAKALLESGFYDLDTFLGSFVMGPEDIRRYVGAGPILTDDHPYLEFARLQHQPGTLSLPQSDIRPFLTGY